MTDNHTETLPASANAKSLTVFRTPSFDESRNGTPLSDEGAFSRMIHTLVADPDAGKVVHKQTGSEVRTLKFNDYRIFYLVHNNSVYLLSIDADGPESAPTRPFKRSLAKLLDRVWLSAVVEAMRRLI
ncbi:hypothetical protein [Aquabacterium sp. OR-4]|uniref:hypothetical protein n=1 Tax=Aquabacterium sp. OR-4 TaxID=2978127 RepID=UPI0021B4C71D|nr:hypothetical protein [Aquabacterium sp. OR-4]MDT7836923.1 hypothetical protein [Aquabacterium sp. OR-4]